MRKFSDDDYEELYWRILHRANNLLLLLQTHIIVKKMGRPIVWRKQRAKELYEELIKLLDDLPQPKEKMGW